MTQISLRITGDTELMTGLNKYAQTIAPVTLDKTRAALERAQAVSPGYLGGTAYTAPLPMSGDHRTGNLGMTTHIDREGLSMRLITQAYSRQGYEYSVGVVGDAYGNGQAEWNVGRWVTERKAVDDEIDKLTQPRGELDTALASSAKESGL